jgi:hypothetical protein
MRDVACNEFTGSLAVLLPVEGGWAARVSMYDGWTPKVHTTIHEAIAWRDELIRADAQAAIAAMDAAQDVGEFVDAADHLGGCCIEPHRPGRFDR